MYECMKHMDFGIISKETVTIAEEHFELKLFTFEIFM